ncbi:CBO0543 family protein [Paenibacillus sp. GD4]|uniref:CBO0543 family protein n=1 Tax=Paenibacillus sp. GD4 TaxID=3068890 RepID=UPI002796C10E|nr:CBO0543 family protein [Paenibacillus sp. GD4]MDQ1913373.1 CBO0543 family protein [Paenibacillus sp. GD4]
MEIIFFIGYLGWIAAAWKWGDWKNINDYMSSTYFFICGSLLYFYLTGADILWRFESPYFQWKHSLFELLLTFVVFPCVTILFLSHYPNGLLKQLLYNLGWALTFGFHEWIVYRMGLFTYFNGWSLGWSVFVDILIFPLLRLNQKKPLYAYLLLIIINAMFFLKFGHVEKMP